MTVHCEW